MATYRCVIIAVALLGLLSPINCRELKATSTQAFSASGVNLYYIGADGWLWNALPRATVSAMLAVDYDASKRVVSAVRAAAWTTWISPLVNYPGPFMCDVTMIQYGKVSTVGGQSKLTGLTAYPAVWPGNTKVRWCGEKKWQYAVPKGNTLEIELTCNLQLKWDIKNAYTPAGTKGVLKLRGKVFNP